jgi:hypothetical protein
MKSSWYRISLLLLSGAALANAGFGTCGGFDSVAPGGPSDMGRALADGGAFPSDMGAVGNGAELVSPMPLSSANPPTTSFVFNVSLTGVTPDEIEPLITITPRSAGSALSGAFSWKETMYGQYQLELLPTGVMNQTDYVVKVGDPLGHRDLVHTGISIGSHPRVSQVELTSNNMAASVYLLINFSEAMSATDLAGKLTVTAGAGAAAKPVSGQLTSMPLAGMPDGSVYRFDFTSGKGLGSVVTLHVQASALATSGSALDPADWDSMTVDSTGNFYVDFTGLQLDSQAGPLTYSFAPTVK